MKCIKCDGGTRVMSSRLPHRRRVCKGCGYRFNTTEVSDEAHVGYDEMLTIAEAAVEARVFVPEPVVPSMECGTLRQIMTLLHEAGLDEQGSDDEQ